jgi:oligosaccharide repeat unit polymerase
MKTSLKGKQPMMDLLKENRLAFILYLAALCTVVFFSTSEFALILISSAPVFVFSIYLMQRAVSAFNITRLTIPAFWYLTYLVMIYFPSFFVFHDLTGPGRHAYLFAVQSAMITVPLGILAVNRWCGFDKEWINTYFTGPVQEQAPRGEKLLVYALFLSFAVASVWVYLASLETIPLLYMLQHPGEVERLIVLREESFKLLDPRWGGSGSTPIFYIYLFLRTLVFPFLIMVSLGYLLISRDGRWLCLFLVTSVTGILYAASSIARAPVAAIVLRVAFFLYVFKQGRLGKKTIAVLLACMLMFPFVVTKMAYGGGGVNLLEALKKVAVRLTYTPAADLYDYFEIFPAHHDYLYGQAFLKPVLVALGSDHFYIENYVYKYRYPTGVASGHSNAAFQSNLHADFGVVGVLLGGFLVGILMQGIQIYILRREKTVLNIALYSFMVYAFWVLNMGSVTSVLFVNGVIPVFLLVLLFNGMERLFGFATSARKADAGRSMP